VVKAIPLWATPTGVALRPAVPRTDPALTVFAVSRPARGSRAPVVAGGVLVVHHRGRDLVLTGDEVLDAAAARRYGLRLVRDERPGARGAAAAGRVGVRAP